MYDVLIVGAGVIGSAIARELSRYQLDVAVLERSGDVAMGTTKANSGIVHAGFDTQPGTLKSTMNLQGNPLFDQLADELDFPFKRIGSLVLCFDDKNKEQLQALYEKGKKQGVPDLRLLDNEELKELEPNINQEVAAALYAPTGGICSPYELNVALAENASANGVEFHLSQEVTAIKKQDDVFVVSTETDTYQAKVLINAAGVYADIIHNLVSKERLNIIPRAGQYLLFDRTVGDTVSHTIFQLPTEMGKGVLVTPTVDGNLLIGPTATDQEDKEDLSTDQANFEHLLESASLTLKHIPMGQVITAFTGLRAHSPDDDFIIDHVEDVPNMIDVAAIESPGLTAAPAIGQYVTQLVGELVTLTPDPRFQPHRKGITHFRLQDPETQQKLIQQDSAYGRMVCRCEMVPEAEIVDAIRRPLGATDLDGVKRRTRAGMGRCQAGFCSPIVLEILARELDRDPTEITQFGGKSSILVGRNKHLGGSKA